MPGTLTAFYDLKVSPTGFDFVTFLALAEIARRQDGYSAFRVVFVPNDDNPFWNREPYSAEYKSQRLRNLLVPLCGLYPACQGSHVCTSREEADEHAEAAGAARFPRSYTTGNPIEDAYQLANLAAAVACGAQMPAWTPPRESREQVAEWLTARARGRKVISITLRQASYFADQNSDIAAWGEFVRRLDASAYFPVLVRDTEVVNDPMPAAFKDTVEFREASVSVHARAALYQSSYLNLMSAGGPMLLVWANPKCRSLVFKLLNLANFRSTPIPLRSMGLEPGRQPVIAGEFQEIVWRPDDAETIATAFAGMVDRIEHRVTGPSRAAESPLVLARRLRKTARYAAARTIYRHIAATDGRRAAAARAGLAMIDFRVCVRPIRSRLIAMIRTLSLSNAVRVDQNALIECAEFRYAIRDRQRAKRYYTAALGLDPNHPEALQGLARLALEEGLLADAVKFLRASVDADRYGAQAYYDLGEALLVTGRDQEARTAFQAAADHDPSHEAARQRLADLDGEDRTVDRVEGAVGQSNLVIPVRSNHHGHDVLYCNGTFYVLPHADRAIQIEPVRGAVARKKPWRRRSPVHVPRFSSLDAALERIENRDTAHRLDDESARYRRVLAQANAIASGAPTAKESHVAQTTERLYELVVCRSLIDALQRELGFDDVRPAAPWHSLGDAKLRDIERLLRSLESRIDAGSRRPKWLLQHIDSYFAPADRRGRETTPSYKILFDRAEPDASAEAQIKAVLGASSNLQQFESNLSALMLRSGDYRAAARYFLRAGVVPPISIEDVKEMTNWLILLIEGYRGHNVLYFSGRFVAVPQALGRIDADFPRRRLIRVHSVLPAFVSRVVRRLPAGISWAIFRLTQKRTPADALLTADNIDELLDYLDASHSQPSPAPRQLAEAAAN